MQAAIIASALGFLFRNAPPSQPTAWWAHALFGYALLAVVVPWMTGGVTRAELTVAYSLVLCVVFALPMFAALTWLADSPYQLVVTGIRILLWLWVLHLSTLDRALDVRQVQRKAEAIIVNAMAAESD